MALKSVSGTIAVSAPADLSFRGPLGALIGQVCVQLEEVAAAQPGTGRQVVSAFNEAFNNLVIHGAAETQECQVEIEVSPERLVLRLKDRGAGFDPTSLPVRDPTVGEAAEGGYGLYIMRTLMSEVRYEQGVNGAANVLTMVRNFTPPERRGHADVQES